MFISNERDVIRLPSNLEYMSIKFAQLIILTNYGQYWLIIRMSVARQILVIKEAYCIHSHFAEDSSEIF